VVSSGTDWLPIAAAVAAAIAIVAIVAVMAAHRRRTTTGSEASAEARIPSLPAVPPAEEWAADGEEARKVINSTLDRLAEYQETHPEEAMDVAPVMEKIDIAREMLGTGANDDALDFAREASVESERILAPKAPVAHSAPKNALVKKKVSRGKGQ
jgi:hypothetical protein